MNTSTRKPRTALITGADGALGAAVCRRFLEAGCEVYGTHLTRAAAGAEGVSWIGVDLSDADSVRKKVGELEEKVALDAVVNCAGGFRYAPVESLPDQDFEFLLNANLRSAFHVCRQTVPGMKTRGYGRLVFVSARATRQATAGMAAYAASKAGVNALVEALAEEVKGFDINVNAVLPSIIDTPANRKDMPKADFSRWVSLDELATIIFELTQPWSRAIHGALIPVSGRV